MTKFQVPVEQSYARNHNEFFRDAKQLQLSAGVLGLIMLIIVAVLLLTQGFEGRIIGFSISLGIFGLLCLIMIPVLPRAMGSPQQYYDMYDLAPAVIAKVNARDMVLLALVDASAHSRSGQTDLIVPSLAIRTVTSIPGVPREVGARVPSMAVTATQRMADKDIYQEVLPMPVAWGTSNEDVWHEAERAIPSNQWARLEDLIDRWEEVQETKHDLLVLDFSNKERKKN